VLNVHLIISWRGKCSGCRVYSIASSVAGAIGPWRFNDSVLIARRRTVNLLESQVSRSLRFFVNLLKKAASYKLLAS